ncbi:GL13104 [Drosophila persimilis]|uniref:pH-sensitive chloride channel 2 n=1 Tax=Drosophila persimilis TaxID=7234 RepID=B4GV63_DROPE|nr:glycine receptor subunit alpha-4 [Drosophila persimilis]EDW26600.1 GL13104 [Drosophila persimilis]
MNWSLIISILISCLQGGHSAFDEDCPTLADGDSLSQTQLLDRLTHGCRYDRLERPITYTETGTRLPVDVYMRAYIYFMQNLEAHDLQFKIYALLQLRYLDPRLNFRNVSPKRRQPILGEQQLRDSLWMPHIFLANERDSSILGTTEKDILTSISPDGTVIVSNRIKATLYCWLNLKKFPFDEQDCSTVLESWMYNTSELVLHWEQKRPITYDPALHLTEFLLQRSWSNETVINADLSDLRHGAFAGNYSSLSFTVHLTRVVGFYLMDYFFPSMLIVAISWVSFWLQADQAPPRITLGTSTMLTFITLASAQGKTLPKVSYIKVSEVWFLGCTIFIFGSMVEFAFVNTIWRRKQNVPVKKLNSKHILKSTLSPHLLRRRSHARSRSFSGMARQPDTSSLAGAGFNNYLTVNLPITTITEGQVLGQMREGFKSEKRKTSGQAMSASGQKLDISFVESAFAGPPLGGGLAPGQSAAAVSETANSQMYNNNRSEGVGMGAGAEEMDFTGWTTLTSQEIAMWIDSRARLVFPVAFLVFNMFFWTFVYCI